MKVGIITNVTNMSQADLIKTWALQKILKEFNAVPVVVNHRIETIKEPVIEEKVTFGGRFKGIFGKSESTKKSADRNSEIPEFITSNFSLIEGNQNNEGTSSTSNEITEEEVGVYQHLDNYVVLQEEVIKILQEKENKYYPNFTHIKDAGILVNQKIYHEISVKPKFTEKYMLVDIANINSKIKEFIDKLAKEKGLSIVQNAMDTKFSKAITTYQRQDIEEYIGFAWSAELVITDNLAGSLMAFIHEKDFVTINNEDTELQNLLKQLKLENHLLKDVGAYQGESSLLLHNKPAFRKAIQEYREKLKNEIKSALNLDPLNEMVDCPTNILKSECCGCSACMEVCPKGAIQMKEDSEGFLYPVVDKNKCIDCNMCARACVKKENPQTITYEESYPKIIAAMNKNEEVRLGSSSGGIFPELVKYAINVKQGYVVGVKYDSQMNVVSDIADNLEDCKAFYGAKYAKSDFSGVFKRIKALLDDGKFVLYSGLPCEAASLKAFLRKSYENLLVCEILCHASPSPKVFRKYVEYLNTKFKSEVTNFKFRDKSVGWLAEHNNIVVEFNDREPLRVYSRKNNYYRNFVKDIIARPGCGNCSFVYKERVGDITLGDFWGIQHSDPSMFDNKGVSILMLNTKKGEEAWNNVSNDFIHKDSDLVTAFKYNHKKPITIKEERHAFFKRIDKDEINGLLQEYNDLR